jgi:hypothetical protein
MFTGLSIQILGTIRAGVFSPFALQPCSYFLADRVAIGSTAWSYPALVIHDSTVSPKHALIEWKEQGWVIQDMDSDNGIRSVQLSSDSDRYPEDGQQGFQFKFAEGMGCCIGAVVLKLKAIV